jgi:hypothetical protein
MASRAFAAAVGDQRGGSTHVKSWELGRRRRARRHVLEPSPCRFLGLWNPDFGIVGQLHDDLSRPDARHQPPTPLTGPRRCWWDHRCPHRAPPPARIVAEACNAPLQMAADPDSMASSNGCLVRLELSRSLRLGATRLTAPVSPGDHILPENRTRTHPVDHHSFRAQLVFSIGFALSRSRDSLRRLLREHAPDDARRELAERVVKGLEGSGFEVDEQARALRQRPSTTPHFTPD